MTEQVENPFEETAADVAVAAYAPAEEAAPEVAVEAEAAPEAPEEAEQPPVAEAQPPAAPETPEVAAEPVREEADKPFDYARHRHFGVQAGPADHPRVAAARARSEA